MDHPIGSFDAMDAKRQPRTGLMYVESVDSTPVDGLSETISG
jgi:hypothetical protein